MGKSILQQFSQWVSNNWTASAIAGGITWDIVKDYLVSPFAKKFRRYFKDDNQIRSFLELLYKNRAINEDKPYRDVEDRYEELTGKDMPEDFIEELKQFIIDHSNLIDNMNMESRNTFNIGSQQAKRDIYNINNSKVNINNR